MTHVLTSDLWRFVSAILEGGWRNKLSDIPISLNLGSLRFQLYFSASSGLLQEVFTTENRRAEGEKI
jgi:hypothetical protein